MENSTSENIAIIGDGAMGTVCALTLAEKKCRVTIWSHCPQQTRQLQQYHENRQFLPGFALPESIRFSPDGKLFALALGDDNRVRLLDASTGEVVCTLEGDTRRMTFVVFSPREELLASPLVRGEDEFLEQRWGKGARVQVVTEIYVLNRRLIDDLD